MKKLFNNIKVIVIILIGVTILFSLLGTFRISMIENMDDSVPKCYADVVTAQNDNQSAGYASYNENINNSKYVLKTQIVPPKGTVCPMKISDSASNYLDSITKEPSVEISESEDSTTSNSYDISIDETNISNDDNSNDDNSNDDTSQYDTTNEPDTQVPYEENIQTSMSPNSQMNQPDTCPPCPACERCPEPAFECKKVPNYRSPSIGQYLPMPILTDFSKF